MNRKMRTIVLMTASLKVMHRPSDIRSQDIARHRCPVFRMSGPGLNYEGGAGRFFVEPTLVCPSLLSDAYQK